MYNVSYILQLRWANNYKFSTLKFIYMSVRQQRPRVGLCQNLSAQTSIRAA